MTEFDLIRRFFAELTATQEAPGVKRGIGDDAAILEVPPGHELVVTTDTLVAGRHFEVAADPAGVGWKALAVNLSDLAAMGAEPRWVTLALTIEKPDERWLAPFAAGFAELAARVLALVGEAELAQAPQRLFHVDRVGASPELQHVRSPPPAHRGADRSPRCSRPRSSR